MIETEVKILEINKEKIENQLTLLKAKKFFEGELLAIYYDFKDKSLSKQRNVLRLRKEGNHSKLTLKLFQHHEKASVNKEFEVDVSDFDIMKSLLENMGMENIKRFTKTRISYQLGDVRIEIDKYHDDNEHIPWFIELESDNYASLKKVISKLGYTDDDCVKLDAFELIDYYSKTLE